MRLSKYLSTALLTVFASLHAVAQEPKLIVAIVVDQLRYDYLEKFNAQFCENGFRLLMDHGAFFTFAHYDYAPTVTGPGHASYLSGTSPAFHGIIGNDWFNKSTQKMVNCVDDPNVQGVGASGKYGSRSPQNFIGSNFADELRLGRTLRKGVVKGGGHEIVRAKHAVVGVDGAVGLGRSDGGLEMGNG